MESPDTETETENASDRGGRLAFSLVTLLVALCGAVLGVKGRDKLGTVITSSYNAG